MVKSQGVQVFRGNTVDYISLSHCRLDELPNTIYWKILISILGMSGYVI